MCNGLQVVVVMHREQPVVSARMIVGAGAARDPMQKVGTAMLTASLLDQGTTTRSASEIADAIDFVGGMLGTGAGTDLTHAQVVVMKDSFAFGLELLSDVIRNPVFTPAEIERQRQQIISGLQVGYEDPDYVASMMFDRLVYGFHPYAFPNNGTPETVSRITRDDLVAFHDNYFAPNNSLLAIVGDVTIEEAMGVTERVFGSWSRREVEPLRPVDPPSPTRRLVIIDKPDAVQTEIRVGHLGVPRRHRDFMALELAIKVLGGEGANRLQRVLRSERGLTYGASADMRALKLTGDFMAETDTRSEATAEALRVSVDEFWRLQRETVHERELADAKAYMAGSFPLRIETPDAIAVQVLNSLFYELPLKELENFRQRVNAVSVADVERVARGYLRPDRLSIVLVGNAEAFVKQLSGVGFRDFEVVPLADLDLFAADLRRPRPTSAPARSPDVLSWTGDHPKTGVAWTADDVNGVGDSSGLVDSTSPVLRRASFDAGETPALQAVAWSDDVTSQAPAGRAGAAAVTPAERESAMAVIGQAIDAKGGIEVLRAVRTIVATTATTLETPQGPVRAETRTYIEYPDRFRVEAQLPVGEVVQVFAGGEVWMRDPSGIHQAPPAMREEFRASVDRDLVALLRRAADGELIARPLPDEKDEKGRALRVVEIWGPQLEPVVLHVEAESGRIVSQSYTVQTLDGVARIVESFSDYRDVDGLQVAYSAELRRDGVRMLRRTVTEFQYNVPVAADLFRRPR
jgi:predicted Zn-dependent peptidase/outer membrane lipoprotein-sorting protein